MNEKEFWKKENRQSLLALLFACVVIGLLAFGLKKGWIQDEGEWNQTGTNVTMMEVDQAVIAEYPEEKGTRFEEAAWLRDDLHAHFGTNPVPVVTLDEYLDADSNVLKAVEAKTKASFETNQ